jgi:hypothetical protein
VVATVAFDLASATLALVYRLVMLAKANPSAAIKLPGKRRLDL